MIKRPLMAVALAAATLVTVAGGQFSPAMAAKRPTVTIGKATATPKSLTGAGGTVTVRVKVTPKNGAIVNSVSAASTLQGATSSGASSTLAAAGNGFFQGTVRIPSNTRTSKITAYVDVQVQSSAGNFVKRKAVKITLGPGSGSGGSDTPPPPPNI